MQMNIDKYMQYAFTRAIADHIFKNYDGVLKLDGDVGNKKNLIPEPKWLMQRRQWSRELRLRSLFCAGTAPCCGMPAVRTFRNRNVHGSGSHPYEGLLFLKHWYVGTIGSKFIGSSE
jgi:hypothetical protein